jgi:hypothetical protein
MGHGGGGDMADFLPVWLPGLQPQQRRDREGCCVATWSESTTSASPCPGKAGLQEARVAAGCGEVRTPGSLAAD